MPTVYPSLTMGAARRLELFKREASEPKRWVRSMTWRDVRFAKLTSHTGWASYADKGERFAYNHDVAKTQVRQSRDSAAGYFRSIERADGKRFRDDTTGYYTDVDRVETTYPVVAKLSHGRFLAGYEWSSNGETVLKLRIYSDEEAAWCEAHFMADRFAEENRAADYRYQEARKVQDSIDEALVELSEAFALRNHPKFTHKRESVRSYIRAIKRRRDELKEYADVL